MECEWTVDETDGCTLQVHCRMKDACQTNECFDVDTLLDRALRAPRDVINSNKIITGYGANYTDQCTANYGMICPHVEPKFWTDYLPIADTTPLVTNYLYPAFNGTANVLTNYVFFPINSWIVTPIVDFFCTPLYDYVLGPVWNVFIATLLGMYDLLPSLDHDTFDINMLEFCIHLLACVLTVSALVIVLFVYFCYVFTDRAKFGVVTRHPLKEIPPEKPGPPVTAACAPGCTQNHVHRRFSYPPGTVRHRKSSLLQSLQRKLRSLARQHDDDDPEETMDRDVSPTTRRRRCNTEGAVRD